MKDFKEMQSESDEVIEIKQDEEECHHRIAELYSHPNCEKLAQICQKRCKNNLVHDMARMHHEKKSVEQFKGKFKNLEANFTKQAQHYIRQLDQIEKNAIDSIAKKKEECINDITEFKRELMKQTYSDLSTKFPHLYEKFKSNRIDTLNCNEVSWVMKMEVHNHNQKHSAMNTKFVAIIKKFQAFKDISKNLTHRLLTNKQSAKDIKINFKRPQEQQVIRLKSNINIERPNYSQDKIKEELHYLQKKKRELESSIRNLNQRNSKLSDEISQRIFMKREKQIRVKIVSKVIDWHFQNVNKQTVRLNNKVLEDYQSESESHSSSLSSQKDQKVPLVNTYPTILQIISKERLAESKEKTAKSTQIVQKSLQDNRMINQAVQNAQVLNDKVSNVQNMVINEQNKEKFDENKPQHHQNIRNQAIQPQGLVQSQPNQEIGMNIETQKQNIDKLDNKDKEKEPQGQVKAQYIQDNDFREWNNKQLVSDIKKFGKTVQQCLKVENIDGLRSFSHVRLPSAKLKISPFFKKINKTDVSPAKPLQYQDLAKILMEQYMKGKEKEKEDKDKIL